jgi:hypothetical protein
MGTADQQRLGQWQGEGKTRSDPNWHGNHAAAWVIARCAGREIDHRHRASHHSIRGESRFPIVTDRTQ